MHHPEIKGFVDGIEQTWLPTFPSMEQAGGACLGTFAGHSAEVSSVAVLGPDRIVSGSWDNTVKIWNTDGECLKTLEGHSGYVYSVAILGPDRIVSGSVDNSVQLWKK